MGQPFLRGLLQLAVQIGERRTRDDASKAHLFGDNLHQAT
jgi:hypothetical protein